ncbi:MAG: DUF4162 domain-containing protein [Candidatus Thermoplasmatota archaeon]|nr:DUF4162 domain-containing protein [Candidatus Thermoplasmatota archaeon]
MNDPDFLIFDEPTSGLDPRTTHEVRGIVQSLTKKNITLILSSHLLHEVQQICDTVAIIDKGKLIKKDKISNLINETKAKGIQLTITCLNLTDEIVKTVEAVKGVEYVSAEGKNIVVYIRDEQVAADINAAIINAGGRITKMEESTPNLEEIFLKLTGGD